MRSGSGPSCVTLSWPPRRKPCASSFSLPSGVVDQKGEYGRGRDRPRHPDGMKREHEAAAARRLLAERVGLVFAARAPVMGWARSRRLRCQGSARTTRAHSCARSSRFRSMFDPGADRRRVAGQPARAGEADRGPRAVKPPSQCRRHRLALTCVESALAREPAATGGHDGYKRRGVGATPRGALERDFTPTG